MKILIYLKNNDFELISTFEQALNKGETYLVYQGQKLISKL